MIYPIGTKMHHLFSVEKYIKGGYQKEGFLIKKNKNLISSIKNKNRSTYQQVQLEDFIFLKIIDGKSNYCLRKLRRTKKMWENK